MIEDLHRLTKLHIEWSARSKSWLDGFDRATRGHTMPYHSPRPGLSKSLITRANDGQDSIEWLTVPVPEDHAEASNDPYVTFLWVAGLGSNFSEVTFDLFANDRHRFTFTNSKEEEWTVDGEDGATLSFYALMQDRFGDLFGYMFMKLPLASIPIGAPLAIRVTGREEGSNAWCMTFHHRQVAASFRKGAGRAFWYRLDLREAGQTLTMICPRVWTGRAVTLTDKESLHLNGILQAFERTAAARWQLKGSLTREGSKPLSVLIDGQEIDLFDLPAASEERASGFIISDDGLLVARCTERSAAGRVITSSGGVFAPLASVIKGLAENFFTPGKIHVIPSSHQDIAWMDAPDQCIEDRDRHVITPALALAAEDPNFRYSVEDTLILKEYLTRHPERTAEIRELTAAGRLEWGATYTQPYESLFSGEALARQLYFGRKWLKKILPGCDTRVAWNVDVPARALQMPQILAKSGVDYLVISRHGKGYFDWTSPDGSKVTTFSPGHYHVDSEFMRQDVLSATPLLGEFLRFWEGCHRRHALPPEVAVIASTDMSAPVNLARVVAELDTLAVETDRGTQPLSHVLPALVYNTSEAFFDELLEGNPELPVITGERPNVWLYIHGPAHHHAVSYARDAAVRLTAAEKFATFAALIEGGFESYPYDDLCRAWEALIYPDHGWGGKNGHITDRVFLEKYRFACETGGRLLDDALQSIARRIGFRIVGGRPFAVFNDLSWSRSDPVRVEVRFARGAARAVRVVDAEGQPVPSEVRASTPHPDGSLETAELEFVARDVPSIGYKTYAVIAAAEQDTQRKVAIEAPEPVLPFENRYYRITFCPGGIAQIHDKLLDRDLLETSKLRGGELFSMHSEGHGAGEFAEVQQPDMRGFDRLSRYSPQWKIESSGEVSTVYAARQKMPHCTVAQKVIVYHTIKRIDFETSLLDWDGEPYREFRLAFPLAMEDSRIAYEIPFGVVEVGCDELAGAAGERYVQACSEVRPREVQNWIHASGSGFGVTLSSSVAVCDFRDPTTESVDYPVLQPLLLASRKSCHGAGNWYLQKGDHHFRFSLFSHPPGWEQGYRRGIQADHPLRAVLAGTSRAPRSLPAEQSFAAIDQPNVLISTIKKCEDDDAVVVRCVEMEGCDRDVELSFFIPIEQVLQTDMIEENGVVLNHDHDRIRLAISRYSIETLKLLR